jgi:SHS2 domain-containing protein
MICGVYRWVDHTSELELEIEAAAEADVFLEALAAFGELVGDGAREPARQSVRVTGESREALLVAWLEELGFLAETQSFVPEEAEAFEVREGELSASLRGYVGEPPHLVKAVTMHRLRFEPRDGGFRARVVFDV